MRSKFIGEQLSECVSSFDVRDQILLMGDLNVMVSDVEVESITGRHGVFSIKNGNEQPMEWCAEKGLLNGNSLFKKWDKYTRELKKWSLGIIGLHIN